jgi:hypothetical protein
VTKEAKTGRTGQISALKLQSSEVGAQAVERTRPGEDPKELRRREERLWEKPRPEDMMADPRDDIVHTEPLYKKIGFQKLL